MNFQSFNVMTIMSVIFWIVNQLLVKNGQLLDIVMGNILK